MMKFILLCIEEGFEMNLFNFLCLCICVRCWEFCSQVSQLTRIRQPKLLPHMHCYRLHLTFGSISRTERISPSFFHCLIEPCHPHQESTSMASFSRSAHSIELLPPTNCHWRYALMVEMLASKPGLKQLLQTHQRYL